MDDKDLGSKKMNNKQSTTDDLSSITKQSQSDSVMKSEMETDKDGVTKIVQRARNTDHDEKNHEPETDKNLSTKPSTASESIGKEMVENRDKNFDIAKDKK